MISARNLACIRGGRVVLEGLSFDVARGQAVRIAGPNGSGKTTLLKTLAGIRRADAGELQIVDAHGVSYCGHANPVKTRLSVVENIRYWMAMQGGKFHPSALATLDITSLADMNVEVLSAGERRRLALTPTLASGCRIWLLDEPTTSMDANSRGLLADAMEHHCANGGAVVHSSHGNDGLPADCTVGLAPAVST